jgi:hypothetical protein
MNNNVSNDLKRVAFIIILPIRSGPIKIRTAAGHVCIAISLFLNCDYHKQHKTVISQTFNISPIMLYDFGAMMRVRAFAIVLTIMYIKILIGISGK